MRKILDIVATFSLLGNLVIFPVAAIAQGATPQPQPAPVTSPVTPSPLTLLIETIGGLLAAVAGFLTRLFGK